MKSTDDPKVQARLIAVSADGTPVDPLDVLEMVNEQMEVLQTTEIGATSSSKYLKRLINPARVEEIVRISVETMLELTTKLKYDLLGDGRAGLNPMEQVVICLALTTESCKLAQKALAIALPDVLPDSTTPMPEKPRTRDRSKRSRVPSGGPRPQ